MCGIKTCQKLCALRGFWVVIFATTILTAIWTWSLLPLMLIGGPRFYGTWHMVMTGTLQHLGLAENVTDHRLNTRTVLMNPISRFLYLNMNYHVEHHMFTMVPYYNLPALHDLIKHDLPAPEPSIGAAFRRMLPVLWRQLKYQEAVIVRDLSGHCHAISPRSRRSAHPRCVGRGSPCHRTRSHQKHGQITVKIQPIRSQPLSKDQIESGLRPV